MIAADRAYEEVAGYNGERRLWRAVLASLCADVLGCAEGAIPPKERDLYTVEARDWIVTDSVADVCDLAGMAVDVVREGMRAKLADLPTVVAAPRRKQGRPKRKIDA